MPPSNSRGGDSGAFEKWMRISGGDGEEQGRYDRLDMRRAWLAALAHAEQVVRECRVLVDGLTPVDIAQDAARQLADQIRREREGA